MKKSGSFLTKLKKTCVIVPAAAFCLFASGCAGISGGEGRANSVSSASPDAAEIAAGDNLLQGIKCSDYKLFLRNAPEGTVHLMDEKKFKDACGSLAGQFGKMEEYSFLTSLETPLVKNLLWKVTFVRKTPDKGVIRQQILFRLITGTLDGRTEVISFGFF